MTAKEYLERGCGIRREIELLHEERNKVYSVITSSTVRLKADKVQASRRDTATENMAKYADYGREIDGKLAQLAAVKTEIVDVIYKLDDSVQRQILLMRYIQGRSWSEIAGAVGYERRYVFKIYAKALKKIDDILEKDTKRH